MESDIGGGVSQRDVQKETAQKAMMGKTSFRSILDPLLLCVYTHTDIKRYLTSP